MNRILLIAVLFLATQAASAQSPLFGLFSSFYLQATGPNGELRRINKPLGIVYSRDFCQVSFPNGDIASFRTINYTKTIDAARHTIHESFVNDEYRTTRRAFYTIMIDRMDDGITFQIAGPSATMIVQGAKEYSENGQVKTGSMKIDWNVVRANQKRADSVVALANIKEQKRRDSIIADQQAETHLHDSLMQVAKQMHIFTGDNPPTSWLISVIKSRSETSHIHKQP